jgi:hypothetical protein
LSHGELGVSECVASNFAFRTSNEGAKFIIQAPSLTVTNSGADVARLWTVGIEVLFVLKPTFPPLRGSVDPAVVGRIPKRDANYLHGISLSLTTESVELHHEQHVPIVGILNSFKAMLEPFQGEPGFFAFSFDLTMTFEKLELMLQNCLSLVLQHFVYGMNGDSQSVDIRDLGSAPSSRAQDFLHLEFSPQMLFVNISELTYVLDKYAFNVVKQLIASPCVTSDWSKPGPPKTESSRVTQVKCSRMSLAIPAGHVSLGIQIDLGLNMDRSGTQMRANISKLGVGELHSDFVAVIQGPRDRVQEKACHCFQC